MRILIWRIVFLALFALFLVSVVSALAAGLSVSTSNLGQESVPVIAEDIKPAACGDLYLSHIVRGSGTITGTPENDLIIAGATSDTIDGLGGDDCILGGGCDDVLAGSEGNDVCIGGAGNNSFVGCEVDL
jgi:Ca2+-binding RTX toxin-like protein